MNRPFKIKETRLGLKAPVPITSPTKWKKHGGRLLLQKHAAPWMVTIKKKIPLPDRLVTLTEVEVGRAEQEMARLAVHVTSDRLGA